MKNTIFSGFATIITCMLAPSISLADATAPTGWVSSRGSDSPFCGGMTLPCRTLKFTHDNVVAPGGSILIQDAGDYGPVVLRKSISIINETGAAMISSPTGTALKIRAGKADIIFLKGIILDGATTGANGIEILSADRVTISGCTLRNFANNGLFVQQTTPINLTITDTIAANNANAGIAITPLASLRATLSRVTADNNRIAGSVGQSTGMLVDLTGTPRTAVVRIAASDSIFSNNVIGVSISGQSGREDPGVSLLHSTISGNSSAALRTGATYGSISVGRSLIEGNGVAVSGFNVVSAGDNTVLGNVNGDGAPWAIYPTK